MAAFQVITEASHFVVNPQFDDTYPFSDGLAAVRVGDSETGKWDHIDKTVHYAVESAFSLLKHGIVGTWHRMSAKHLQAYLDEMCWRLDNRRNPYLFRATLLKMLEAEHVEFKKLVAEAA